MSDPGIVAEAVIAVVPVPLTYPVKVVAPVPPLATTTVPVTLEAVPLTEPIIVLENVLTPAIV